MNSPALPELPYKGLSYYGPDDVEIFAAREEDVWRVARTLSEAETRILILHGRTGCGKSSFLRAGLIPFLERPEHGFLFMKESRKGTDSAVGRTIFLRATGNPLLRLALAVNRFCGTEFEIDTPTGRQSVNFEVALQKYEASTTDLLAPASDGEYRGLIQVLRGLGRMLPKTLVVVVDQGEEVLTQGGSRKGRRFFQFLAAFCETRIDVKILISLRTDFYGEFADAVAGRVRRRMGIREEMLRELTSAQIARAIRYPSEIGNGHYRFEYEEGVPETIAADLVDSRARGGVLPVMQIVCGRLYREVTGRAHGMKGRITLADYRRLGVRGQVARHVEGVLRKLCTREGVGGWVERELDRWYEVLEGLVSVQVDGTVTTVQRTQEELRSVAERLRCKVAFERAMAFLSNDEERILRRDEVYNVEIQGVNTCYSLGHDCIGLAVTSWRSDREAARARAVVTRYRYVSAFGMVASLTAAIVATVATELDVSQVVPYWVVMTYAMVLLMVGWLRRR